MMHIELIEATEKLTPSLGGTGYLPPRHPADAQQLSSDAHRRVVEPLQMCVWKVARRSVGWHNVQPDD